MTTQGRCGGPSEPRKPRVRLSGDDPSHGGFLEVEARDIHGEAVELLAWLAGRLVWVLAALAAARAEDERQGVSEEAAGWRRPDKLAAWVGQFTGWTPEEVAIRSYMSKIQNLLRAAARRAYVAETPVLIERRKGRGARIAAGGLDLLGPLTPGPPGPA
jgi:hypothetical protein